MHIDGSTPLFLVFNVALAALLCGLVTWLVVRKDRRRIKLATFFCSAALFPAYLQFAWLPSAYLAGLAFATLSLYKAPLAPGLWSFAISSSIIAAGIAWLLAHGLKRLINWLCSGFATSAA